MKRIRLKITTMIKKYLKKKFLIGLGFLLFIIFIFVYRFLSKPSVMIETPLSVQTIRVKTTAMPISLKTIGILEAQTELTLKIGTAGRLETWQVEAGSAVKQGTLLATVIGAPNITAPFSGYLGDYLVKPGEYIHAGTPLIHLIKTDTLWVRYTVPEYYAAQLALDQAVLLKYQSLTIDQIADKTLKAEVRFIAPAIDPKTHTILIKALVPNADQTLWPGQSVEIEHILQIQPEALVIPESTLIPTLEGYEVLRVLNGELKKQSVHIGSRQSGRVQILSGLHTNDCVLFVRTYSTREGLKVLAQDWTGTW